MKIYKNLPDLLGMGEKDIKEIIQNKNTYYYSYPIKKKNGTRRFIDAPIGKLKKIQKIIMVRLLYRFGAHPIAYGFVKNKNQANAASKHIGQKVMVSMDIKNFFNSITKDEIISLFLYLDKKEKLFSFENNTFTNICNLAELLTYKNVVPQGAPSSPVLSNLYMLKADKVLEMNAKTVNATVTRYADDITYSGDLTNDEISFLIQITKKVLKVYKLKLNPRKTHISRNSKRMQVVGIVVNEKLNIKREVWRNFRAELHNLKVSQEPVNEELAQILRGKIEWYKMLNPKRGKQFLKEFGQLNFLNTLNISIPTEILKN